MKKPEAGDNSYVEVKVSVLREMGMKVGIEALKYLDTKNLTDNEIDAILGIIQDCEIHHHMGSPNIFTSRDDFDAFLDSEVRFHAKTDKVDFEKAKEVVIEWWAKEYHSAEYEKLL